VLDVKDGMATTDKIHPLHMTLNNGDWLYTGEYELNELQL
jgi:hypothetical protein